MKKIILVLLAFISTGAEAKLSSEKIEKQAENINTVLSVCAFDRSSLDDIKGKAIGSTITSGVATGASAAGAVTSFVALGKTKDIANNKGKTTDVDKTKDDNSQAKALATNKDKDVNSQVKNLRLISTISSGVATGANLATVVLSATSATKLAELMDKATYCNNALGMIEISE
ncbi:MAG: hypothetical protein J6J27_03045 [Alphaproteobacteria bacterium]|nr:hypothetical protein [Alphaproteobacteria bacterium]